MDISYSLSSNGTPHRFNYRVAALIERNGRFLISHPQSESFAFLPGGRVKIGETAENALYRELQEELNLTVTASRAIFHVENFFTYGGEAFHEIGLFFHLDGSALPGLPEDGEIRDQVLVCHGRSPAIAIVGIRQQDNAATAEE